MPDELTHQLQELREQQERIDQKILALLAERARHSEQISRLREQSGLTIPDADEPAWLARLVDSLDKPLSAEAVLPTLRAIRTLARAIEQPVVVAYVGEPGGFCHVVAERHFGHTARLMGHPTTSSALDEVVRERAAFAVFPFESSADGLNQPSLTALANTELLLVAQRTIAATFGLFRQRGAEGRVERIVTTAAAQVACEQFLRRDQEGVDVEDVRSAAAAVERAEGDPAVAALVPEPTGRAAASLAAVAVNVGDAPDHAVRFGIAGARPVMRSGKDVTMLLCRVDERPGALFEMMRPFAERGVTIRQLQSRPVAGSGWEYVYYVELEGHETDRAMVTALEQVRRLTKYVRVLGSCAANAAPEGRA